MTSRRLSLILALPAAFVLAACSSATSGHGSSTAGPTSGAASGGSSGAPAPAPAPGSATPSNAKALGALMQRGLATIQTAHIALSIDAAGQTITGSGDEKLVAGQLTALNLTETVPGAGELQLIQIDKKTYAKLPPSLNKSGKPWVLVSPNSSDATVRQLAASLATSQSSASLGSVTVFVTAADSVKLVGPAGIGGMPTTHYSVTVNPAKLPSDYPGKDALIQTGVGTIPVELYVDSEGRPVQVTENITVSGQAVSTKVSVSRYNQPVTIAAPPADQVSTK